MKDKLTNLNMIDTSAEHECRAAAINAVLVRCRQNNRGFFTAEDARASDLVTRTLMSLGAVDEGVREGAPQTMPTLPSITAFAAVEGALRNHSDDVKIIA